MSTRCQVQVVRVKDGLEAWIDGETRTLYHHSDGYPDHMLPVFERAWEQMSALGEKGTPFEKYRCNEYQLDRPGYVAGWLCTVDPGRFEPENTPSLHADIEYLYVLEVSGKGWTLRTLEPKSGFWDDPKLENMKRSGKMRTFKLNGKGAA